MNKVMMLALASTALTLGACATMPAAGPAGDASAAVVAAPQAADALAAGFIDPPNAARPRVWWHWMNGNVTEEGIARDFDWMHRMGIGGVQNFDANLSTPQVVENRLVYMEPEWQQAFRFAGTRAEELGLEMAIAASPGWSETGGPWVPPQDGLKKLVWSETSITGGSRFTGRLAAPPGVTGPFQSIGKQPGIAELMGGGAPSGTGQRTEGPQWYEDVRVLAFPVAATAPMATPQISLVGGDSVNLAALTDGDLVTAVAIPRGTSEAPPQIRFDFARPQTVRSLRLFMPGAAAMFLGSSVSPVLEASDDGEIWRKIIDLSAMPVPTTSSFPAVTARHFRVVIAPGEFGVGGMMQPAPGVSGGDTMARLAGVAETPLNIAELALSADPVIDHFEAKAGFEIEPNYYHLPLVADDAPAVDPAQVIDITAHMQPDGSLDWTPPAGQWKVLRLGWSLLGTTNHPATPEATGLEVDKFDGPAVRRYLEHYLGMYAEALGEPVAQQDMLDAILTDSIEVGAANWTPRMVEQFTALRGYDPVPWLPTLTGTIIGSREASDRFLYDYRRTLGDLLAREHYGTVAEVAHEHGLTVYGEALENGRPSLGDDLSMRSFADIPMAAMWTHSREAGPNYAHVADIRGAASVANIYGRSFVAAESMTSAMQPWDHVPSYLKRIIDLEFVNGVNRPVIHTSVHQPSDEHVPGLSLFIFGQYFNRHESWAPLARPWVDYLSRTSYMLQQGRNVADVAYFYGEDAPPASLYQQGWMGDAPQTHAWDFVSPDALTGVLTNGEGGTVVSPGGARYSAIFLSGTSHMMTLPVLERLAALVRGGATVIGPKPEATPSLADDATRFAALADALWSGDTGAGRVIDARDAGAALAGIGVAPAFRFTGASADARIPFLEREWPEAGGGTGRLFFLSNPGATGESIEARFRATGMVPELWDAVSGTSRPLSYRVEGGETVVSLRLESDDSLFVVFRQPTTALSATVAEPVLAATEGITMPWTVSFEEGRRGPATFSMAQLVRWDEAADPALRYFSGVATYTNSFAAPGGWTAGDPLWLDLGEVYDLAEVWINGQRAGGLWRAPYRIDVGALAQAGANSVEIRVANRWVNRLIGDAQPGAEGGTFVAGPSYAADAPLRPSGLIGPVSLVTSE